MVAAEASNRDLRVTKKEEAAYLKAARSWDDDQVAAARRSAKTAWWLAAVASTVAALAIAAVVGLTPLKTVEPYLVRVDSSTGIVDNVVRVRDATLGKDEMMNRYFLRKYVTLRETYTRQQLQANFDQLALLTAPRARAQLKNEWHLQSPASPYAKYGELGTAEVKIKNTTFVAPNVGQVRYFVVERKQGVETQRHMLATIEFQYVTAPAGEEARAVNPLGFQAINWRSDPEAVITEDAKP
jgi:type IV secretion system protein VirB8